MECSICYETPSRTTKTRLECGHIFCFRCIHQWIVANGHYTCPMCRKETDYFSRATRSCIQAGKIIFAYNIIHPRCVSCTELCVLLELLYVPYHHVWRRPDMIKHRRNLIHMYTRLLHDHSDHLPPHAIRMIQQLSKQFL